MVASFNFYAPPVHWLVGAGLLAMVVIAVAARGGPILGGLTGAVGWGGIAAIVFGAGSGDLKVIIVPVVSAIAALAGAVVGAACGAIWGRGRD